MSKKVGVMGLPALWRKTAGRAAAGGAAPCGLETDSTCLFPGSCRALGLMWPPVTFFILAPPRPTSPASTPDRVSAHERAALRPRQESRLRCTAQLHTCPGTRPGHRGLNLLLPRPAHVVFKPRRRRRATDSGDLLTKVLNGPLTTHDFNPSRTGSI